MKFPAILTALVSLQFAATAFADVPVTFQPGTPARAADVNQNFSDLDTRLNASLGGIIISSAASSSGDGVAGTSCPSSSIVLSANCRCEGDGLTRNFGILFSCSVAGNGGVAGCFDDGLTFDPFLMPPVATVELRCGSGVTNDGQILMPVILSESASISGVQKSGMNPESSKTAADELESKVKAVNDQLLDRRSRLSSAQ